RGGNGNLNRQGQYLRRSPAWVPCRLRILFRRPEIAKGERPNLVAEQDRLFVARIGRHRWAEHPAEGDQRFLSLIVFLEGDPDEIETAELEPAVGVGDECDAVLLADEGEPGRRALRGEEGNPA